MASTENIEAKLCAYVEGELDSAGVAEIEKHLASHPQHRALLGELMRTRQMLQSLPLEQAPEDIRDLLQGQMERAELLGDVSEDSSGRSLRISRWPQIMAAAAVVLLAVGLGVVIYSIMLPAQGPGQYAVGPVAPENVPSEARIESRDAAPAPEADRRAFRGMAQADRPAEPMARRDPEVAAVAPEVAQPSPLVAPAAAGEEVVGRELRATSMAVPAAVASLQDRIRVAQERLRNAELAQQLKQTPEGFRDNSLFVVVTTDDAADTSSQVANYLNDNRIQFEPIPSEPPQPLQMGQNQVALLSRQAPVKEMELSERTEAAAGVGAGQGAGGSGSLVGAAVSNEAVAESEAQDRVARESVARESVARAERPLAEAPAAPTAEPQAAPPAGEAVADQAPAPQVESDQLAAAERDDANAAARDGAAHRMQSGYVVATEPRSPGDYAAAHGGVTVHAAEPPQQLILARGMTKSQALELQNNLRNSRKVQRAAVYDQSESLDEEPGQKFFYEVQPAVIDAWAGPTTSPADLATTLGLTPPPPADAATQPADAAATQPAETPVAEAAKPVEGSLDVAVAAPATQPTAWTERTAGPELATIPPPAAEAAVPPTPATQPTTQEALSSDVAAAIGEIVDVVIVVQGQRDAAVPAQTEAGGEAAPAVPPAAAAPEVTPPPADAQPATMPAQ